jgi:hypothetical protein
MIDIVICALPQLFLDRPPAAPAMLKAAAIQAGFTARTLDLSLGFFKRQCHRDIDVFNSLGASFRPSEQGSQQSQTARDQWCQECVDYLASLEPRVIGLSVFSMMQHRAAWIIAQALRHQLPHVKIIIGGFGIEMQCSTLDMESGIRKIDLVEKFHVLMKKRGLCDGAIHGTDLDGYIALLEQLLAREADHQPRTESSRVFDTPIPDYDDYDLGSYVWNEERSLPITGSKGCVRSCTFCDIPGKFGRFSFRTGETIANEMIALKERYDIKTFAFTDSLVNGSLKMFREWMSIVANYNRDRPSHDHIRWVGQYICRPQHHTPSDIYDLMQRSGALNLVIGVESGNDEVLKAMKKQMQVQDVFDELEKFEQHGLQATFLMFSGFYNENWSRYLDTLRFVVRLQPWLAKGVITKLSIGAPLFISEFTHLHQHAEELGIQIDPEDYSNWTVKDDPENTFVNRAHRRLITQLLLDRLGISNTGIGMLFTHSMLEQLKRHRVKLEQQYHELDGSSHTQ